MNSRELVIKALNYQEPDRAPFDLGGIVVSGITIRAYQVLRIFLRFPDSSPRLVDVFQQFAQVDDDRMAAIRVGARNIASRSSSSFQISRKDCEDRWERRVEKAKCFGPANRNDYLL